MVLYTERLTLKEVTASDLEYVHKLHSLPETDRYNTLGIPGSVDETRILVGQWVAMQRAIPQVKYVLSIKDKERNFLGLLGINIGKEKFKSAELWYKLLPVFWNRGYATEAVKGALGFCFQELRLHRVEAGCAAENCASARVLLKAGMRFEGMKRELLPIRGEWSDGEAYGILERDYLGMEGEQE